MRNLYEMIQLNVILIDEIMNFEKNAEKWKREIIFELQNILSQIKM